MQVIINVIKEVKAGKVSHFCRQEPFAKTAIQTENLKAEVLRLA